MKKGTKGYEFIFLLGQSLFPSHIAIYSIFGQKKIIINHLFYFWYHLFLSLSEITECDYVPHDSGRTVDPGKQESCRLPHVVRVDDPAVSVLRVRRHDP